MALILNISLPIAVDLVFSYVLPKNFGKDDLIGKRALVPFKNQIKTGVIIETSESDNVDKLKEIYEILDPKPVITHKSIELARWIAEYYMTTLGETLRLFMPPGISPKSVRRIKIKDGISNSIIYRTIKKAPIQGKILKILASSKEFVSVSYLKKSIDMDNINSQITALSNAGYIDVDDDISKESHAKFQKAVKLSINDEKNVYEQIAILDKKAPKQALFLSIVYQKLKNGITEVLLSDLHNELNTSFSVSEALEKKGLIEIIDKRIDRTVKEYDKLSEKNEILLTLTDEQIRIVDEIINSYEKKDLTPFLLHGITGSGKTLIYLHIIKYLLDKGLRALFIVPEISLTPQLTDRFQNAFPGRTAILHSKMSEGERYDSWYKILNNEVDIIVGARSSLFAPISNIGIIIVDEEHDRSYKQEAPNPKYNGRDIAIVRAKLENALVLLGSATPSFESYYNATNGKYKLLELMERADNALLPEIQLIDMKNNLKSGQNIYNFSKQLLRKIVEKIKKNEGVILLQNRRGFSASLFCQECGHIPMCKNCDISMTYHKRNETLKCHYCGHSEPVYQICPECNNPEMKTLGSGTQRIEDELEELLIRFDIKANIERFDLDSTSKKDSHRRILSRFSKGETDILIGTQMVAKGIDFDRVTLVGILSADIQLFIPDFRASERTFSLITQVSGRAGRSSQNKGEVIIQTYNPDNVAISFAIKGDYSKFYNNELLHREKAKYPPFSRFIYIEFRAKNENLCHTHARLFKKLLPTGYKSIEVLGPAIPAIARLKTYYRRIIVIKNIKEYDKSAKKLRKILKDTLEAYNKNYKTHNVSINIDIDSQLVL